MHDRAGTIRNRTEISVELKFETKNGTQFVQGEIVAHGGKYFLSP